MFDSSYVELFDYKASDILIGIEVDCLLSEYNLSFFDNIGGEESIYKPLFFFNFLSL